MLTEKACDKNEIKGKQDSPPVENHKRRTPPPPQYNLSKHNLSRKGGTHPVLAGGIPHPVLAGGTPVLERGHTILSWLGGTLTWLGDTPSWGPPPGTWVPLGRDLGLVIGYPPGKDMGPVEVLWDGEGYPPRNDMGPLEVLWDGDGVCLRRRAVMKRTSWRSR